MIATFGKRLVLAAMALGLAAPIAAEQPTLQDALLDKLEGAWVITGTIAGEETTDDLDVAWVNQHQYLRLHEVSRGRRPDGRSAAVGCRRARRRLQYGNAYECSFSLLICRNSTSTRLNTRNFVQLVPNELTVKWLAAKRCARNLNAANAALRFRRCEAPRNQPIRFPASRKQ